MHQSHSLATTDRLSLDPQGNSIAYDLPAFTVYDAALGAGKDAWRVQLYGENLTDKRAQLYANYSQWYKAITVNRPEPFPPSVCAFSYAFKYGKRCATQLLTPPDTLCVLSCPQKRVTALNSRMTHGRDGRALPSGSAPPPVRYLNSSADESTALEPVQGPPGWHLRM